MMEIKDFMIRRIHWPDTKPEDDYVAIKINGEIYRTEDIDMVKRECSTFLKGESVPETTG